MSQFAVILPAAGKSSRFHDPHYKKPFAPLNDRAVWLHAAERFLHRDDVKQVILVISPEDREYFQSKFAANVLILGIEVVDGGAERADSVQRGLERVRDEIDYVAIHDAARPCLANEWIDDVFAAAEKHAAAILAIPIAGTVKRVDKQHQIESTVDRSGLWEAQTPQVFRRELILDAYAKREGRAVTDEAQLLELTGHPVHVVTGSPINMKITTKDDLRLAGHALKALPKPKGLGQIHPFGDDDMWR